MATWYAQNSSVAINSANMWYSHVTNDGLGSFYSWSGTGPAGDVLCANGKTGININVNTTVLRISTLTEGGGTASGGFTVTSGVTITADITAGGSACVVASSTGYTLIIVGNITAAYGGPANRYGLSITTGITALNITGNLTGQTSPALMITAAFPATIYGNITGGAGSTGYGLRQNSTGNITIIGGLVSTSAIAAGIYTGSSSNITIYASVKGSDTSNTGLGIFHAGTGTITIIGDVTGGALGSTLYSSSTGSFVVFGNIISGPTTVFYSYGSGNLIVNGGNIINNSPTGTAILGSFIYNPMPNNYISYPGPNSTTIYLAQVNQSIANQLLYGTKLGNITGTLQSTFVIPAYSGSLVKTVQTELQGITAVAANNKSISSILTCSTSMSAMVYIDHAMDSSSPPVGSGTQYRIEVSEKSSGNDTWRSIYSVVSLVVTPTGIVVSSSVSTNDTSVACSTVATTQAGQIMFFKNSTIANSEWAKIASAVVNTSFAPLDPITNNQTTGTYYDNACQWAIPVDLSGIKRLRVVCNNNNGTTNQAIVWRCAVTTCDAAT